MGGPPGRGICWGGGIPGLGWKGGGACWGTPAGGPLGGLITGAPITCGRGSIDPGAGPPTPLAGPASPVGACPGGATGRPLPAALPTPGPVGAICPFCALSSSVGGGPSMVSDTISSPRSSKSPKTRRSSLSASDFPFFGGSFLYSSVSAKTKLKCLSNARNLPIN